MTQSDPVFVLWLLLHYPEVVFFTLAGALLAGFAYMVGAGLRDVIFPKPAANVRPESKKPQRRNAATP